MAMTEEEKKYITTEDGKEYITSENFSLWLRDYWSGVAESEGFDIEDVSGPPGINGILIRNCQRGYRLASYVKCYAMLGLHRYNILEGTSYQLQEVLKYNMLQNCLSSYYMTLDARDPARGSVLETFQVRVDEGAHNSLDLVVSVARIKDKKDEVTTKAPFIPHYQASAVEDSFFDGELPDWPSDVALKDARRFYKVPISEWQSTDWIDTYLELLLTANDRRSVQLNRNFLSTVRIVKVAIETNRDDVEPSNERLHAYCANVYITFKGLEMAPRSDEIGEHVERKAIVRRVIDSTGSLTLVGKLCSGVHNEQRSKKQSRLG